MTACSGSVNLTIFLSGEHGRTVNIPKQEAQQVDNQDQLEARTMMDSYQEAIIPLGSDVVLRQEYLNFFQVARYIDIQ